MVLFWLSKSELYPKLFPSVAHSLDLILEGMLSCGIKSMFNLEFSPNLFCSKLSSGVVIFFCVDTSDPRYSLQFSWCLPSWLVTFQASSNVTCEKSSVWWDTPDVQYSLNDLASGLVFWSERKEKYKIPYSFLLKQMTTIAIRKWMGHWLCFEISPAAHEEVTGEGIFSFLPFWQISLNDPEYAEGSENWESPNRWTC